MIRVDSPTHREHALVGAEKEGGDSRRSDGWLSLDADETKVFQVADKRRGGVGEGERVAPEEPLERSDGDTAHREEEHRQGVLPSQETGIQQADTGNHDPNERHGRDDCRRQRQVDGAGSRPRHLLNAMSPLL